MERRRGGLKKRLRPVAYRAMEAARKATGAVSGAVSDGAGSVAAAAKQGKSARERLATRFTGSLASWDETEIETLHPSLLAPAAIREGTLEMEHSSLGDINAIGSHLRGLTLGTLDKVTMGVSDQVLTEVGQGDLSDAFRKRWVVMWRHPDLTRGPYHLVWYDSQKAKQPAGNIELTRGAVTIANPKKVRKGHNFTFELTVRDEEEDEDFHAVFGAETFGEKVAWMNVLTDYNQEEEYVDDEDVARWESLPKIHHLNYEQLPAEALTESAERVGYIHKQGKGGMQKFEKRWFVLWRHPMSTEDGWAWLWYDDETSTAPNNFRMLKVGSYGAAVLEDATKKKKKHAHRFKLEVEEDGEEFKYVLATDTSADMVEWVDTLMALESQDGVRAAAGTKDFGDDEEETTHSKIYDTISGGRSAVAPYKLPPKMRSQAEIEEMTAALSTELATAMALKQAAREGEEVDVEKDAEADEQIAATKAKLQDVNALALLEEEVKEEAKATAQAYAVLADETVKDTREDAYSAAVACLLSGKMSDLEDVPTPPAPMTANECEMLRHAILAGPKKKGDVPYTIPTHEKLFDASCDAAKHLLDDLERQISTSTTLTESEIMRAKFLQKNLANRPPYSANLVVQGLRGAQFRPSSGWLKGTNPALTVVVRPLVANPDVDPDEIARSTNPSMVNKSSGDVNWGDEQLRFELHDEATMVQIQVMYRDSVLGSKTVPLKWMPAPHFKSEEMQFQFRISAEEMRRMEGMGAKVGRSKLGQVAKSSGAREKAAAAKEKAAAAKEKAAAGASAAKEKGAAAKAAAKEALEAPDPAKLAAEAAMQKLFPLIKQATGRGGDGDESMARATLAEAAAHSSPELSHMITLTVAKSLRDDNPETKQSTLMLLDTLASSGGLHFKTAAKRNCLALVEADVNYTMAKVQAFKRKRQLAATMFAMLDEDRDGVLLCSEMQALATKTGGTLSEEQYAQVCRMLGVGVDEGVTGANLLKIYTLDKTANIEEDAAKMGIELPAASDDADDSAVAVIKAYANKIAKKIAHMVGEKVQVYSQSLESWQDGTVIEVTPTSVKVVYGDRSKSIDLADPYLDDVLRVPPDPNAEPEPEPETPKLSDGRLRSPTVMPNADDEGFRDRSSFKLPATPAEVPSRSPPESPKQPAPADLDGSSAAFAASSGLELVQDSEDEDSEEEEEEEGGDMLMELDDSILSSPGINRSPDLSPDGSALERSTSVQVSPKETMGSVARRMSVQHGISEAEMQVLLGITPADAETTVEEAATSKSGRFKAGFKAKGGGLKAKAKAKKEAAQAKAREKAAAAKAKAQDKAANAKARAKGELTSQDEVKLLISFFANVGSKRELDEDDVKAMIDGEGFQNLVARLEQQYHINPIERYKAGAAASSSDEPQHDRTPEFEAHLAKAKPYLSKIEIATRVEDSGPDVDAGDCVAATQSLLSALGIRPESEEVVNGLHLVADAKLQILSSVCVSVMQQYADSERTRERDQVFPFVRSIARRNVEEGQKLIATDGRAALKSLQMALQLDPRNPDAQGLFGEAEAAILEEQAAAEQQQKKQLITDAEAKVKELQEKMKDFHEDIEAEKYAAQLAAKATGTSVDSDDDELTEEQEDQLAAIADEISAAEVAVKKAKQDAMPTFRGWVKAQGGRLEQREGAVADRLSWKRRFAVLENGVLSYYPNEALSQEVKNEMFVKKRKQEEVVLDMTEGMEARWKVIVEEFDVGFQAFFSSEKEDMEYDELHVKARKTEELTLDLTEGQRARWNLTIAAFDVAAKVTFTTESGTEMVVQDREIVGNPDNPRQGGKYNGSYVANGSGTLTLYVDNSYSKMRGKHVKYFLYEMDPEPDVADPVPEDDASALDRVDSGRRPSIEDLMLESGGGRASGAAAALAILRSDDTRDEAAEEETPPSSPSVEGSRDSMRSSMALQEHKDDQVLAPYRIIGNPKDAKEGGTTSGSFVADRDGRLILLFDNSYSKLRTKRLLYTLEDESPMDDSDDEGSVDISGEDGEQLEQLDLSLCEDPPFQEEVEEGEGGRIGIEMPDRTYMFECESGEEFKSWSKGIENTLLLLFDEKWMEGTDEDGDEEKVGEGVLHLEWQLHFRELLAKNDTPDYWVSMGAAGSDEDAPKEPTWSLVGNGDNLYKVLCRELLHLEEISPDNAETGAAIDWLCEELCLRAGIGDKRRTLIELRVALSSFRRSATCISRVGRALKRSKVFADDLTGCEKELYDSICTYVHDNLLDMFKLYKIEFAEDEAGSEARMKAALECFEAVSDNWDEVTEALRCWPQRLLGVLVGTDLVNLEDWSQQAFTAKMLNQLCDVATPDLTLDDECFRFIFPDSIAMVDVVCGGYIDVLEKALAVIMANAQEEHFSKGWMLFLYQAARDVFAMISDISPMLHDTLTDRIHGVTELFAPVLDAHIERVSAQQEKWLNTSIRQDNSEISEKDGEKKKPWQPLLGPNGAIKHSVSVDDVYRMLFQVSRPLMQYWSPKYIAKVVRYAIVQYCEQLKEQLLMTINSGDASGADGLFGAVFGEAEFLAGYAVNVGADAVNLGFGALTALTKGAGGVFTETYKGAKKGGAVGLAKGLTKGTLGAVTTTVGTSLATARAATELARDVVDTGLDVSKTLVDDALKEKDRLLTMGADQVNEFGVKVGLVEDEEEEQEEEEEPKMFPDSFWVKMNNLYRAGQQLDELAMDSAPLFGDDMTDLDIDEVDNEIVKASSECRKILTVVLHGLMERYNQVLMACIAKQVSPVAEWAKAHSDEDREGMPEVSWDETMDFCDLVLGEPHEHLYEDVFNRLLRELCITWTKAVENILSATAESLPKLAIEELENAIQVLNVDMWNQSTTEATSDLQGSDKLGGFTNKFVTRMCGASSRVMQVIDLHKETTETLAQIVVDVKADTEQAGSYSEVQSLLAIGVLARRPDYMKVVLKQVKSAPDQTPLSLFLPPPEQVNLKNLPAKMLADSAEHQGPVDKEITTGGVTGNFRKRWLVLWRHPEDSTGSFTLLWYEKEDSKRPKGMVALAPGTVTVTHPKNKRKGHENAFRMDVTLPDDEELDEEEEDSEFKNEVSEKQIIACKTYEEMVAWMKIIGNYTTGAEEFERQMAEEEERRRLEQEKEDAEEAERQARARAREEELARQEEEARQQAEAERIAQERAEANRREAERLAAERKAEAEAEKRRMEEEEAENRRRMEAAAEELRLAEEQAKVAAEEEKSSRAQKKLEEARAKAEKKKAEAERQLAEAEESKRKAALELEERQRLEAEQKAENEQRAREAEEAKAKQEAEREAALLAAREKAEAEAAAEEQERLKAIAEKKAEKAAEAKKKEMLAKIPAPDQMKLDATPCEILRLSPLAEGYLYKEGSQGKKSFKQRYFVLWRHPDLIAGDYALVWYETPESQIPKGHQVLPVGSYNCSMPKKRRKGYDHCFRIDVSMEAVANAPDGEDGRKFILAAQTQDPEGEDKMKLWQDALKKIEADAPAEKAAEAAEAAKGSPAKSPKGAGESLDDAADKMKAMQDKITADLVGAGIESVIKNTPAASIAPTALKTGWLRKEGKGNKAFKRRFFVLWSTPDAVARMGEFKGESATPDAVVMAYYEKPGSQAPKGYVTVEAGELSAKPPKKKRKGAAHCMRVDQNGSKKSAQFKLVLGAENDDDLQHWIATLSRFN